jgi:RNA recognition motif-containing protein
MYLYLILKKCNWERYFFRTEINEEEIRNIFSEYGTIKRFKFFEKDRKMALIEMDTIEQAIAALIVRWFIKKIK